ncbi:MAG: ATP-binding protein [Promethearchaeota archaeon]
MSESSNINLMVKYRKTAEILNSAGGAYPISDSLLGILKITIPKENLDFLTAFEGKTSQTMKQLKESLENKGVELSEEEILRKVNQLARNGVMMDQPTSTGIMIFRVLPIYRQFEYIFMRDLENSKEDIKELARLYHDLHKDTGERIQNNYDNMASYLEKVVPIDRTIISSNMNKSNNEEIEIIMDKTVEIPQEMSLPAQSVKEIIEKYEDIAVGHCFCRNHAKMLGNPCKQTNLQETCFTFGKSARHTSKHGFSRLISKEEALKIFENARDDGLVQKAYHYKSNPQLREDAICNCCNDCCPNSLGFMYAPTANVTNFLAKINEDLCVGCGTCVEKCHNQIIILNDDGIAERDEEKCIGCGVCAYFCPENAISMVKTELRIVRMMPPRKK